MEYVYLIILLLWVCCSSGVVGSGLLFSICSLIYGYPCERHDAIVTSKLYFLGLCSFNLFWILFLWLFWCDFVQFLKLGWLVFSNLFIPCCINIMVSVWDSDSDSDSDSVSHISVSYCCLYIYLLNFCLQKQNCIKIARIGLPFPSWINC